MAPKPRDPSREVLLLNDNQSVCDNCDQIHEFYTLNCQPCSFPADYAVTMGQMVPVPPDMAGVVVQAQFKANPVLQVPLEELPASVI